MILPLSIRVLRIIAEAHQLDSSKDCRAVSPLFESKLRIVSKSTNHLLHIHDLLPSLYTR
jgi:hypothetical protein